jgi:hypothetical protein
VTEVGNDIRAPVSGSLITAREDLAMYRIRFILTGAVVGIAWACSLRGFMQQLAGADSTFTFAGTFGVIIPAGTVVGALLGWAEYQRRADRQHRLLILAPLLIGIIPVVFTAQLDTGPIGLALLGLIGGYSVSGRGWPWVRIVAGIIALAVIPITFLAPKPSPDLSVTTAHGAWFCTLAASLYACLALASSIPMYRPAASRDEVGPTPAVPDRIRS